FDVSIMPFPGVSIYTSRASLAVEQNDYELRATMWSRTTAPSWAHFGSARQAVEFVVTSPTPTLVDIRASMHRPDTVCQGFVLSTANVTVDVVGHGSFDGSACPNLATSLTPFECRHEFSSVLVDSNGVAIQAVVESSVGTSAICGSQGHASACLIEVVPAGRLGGEYGLPCGTYLSAKNKFLAPSVYDVIVRDAGATMGVFMIGNDQIALSLLGCKLHTTPFVSIPLMLDPGGAILFPSILPTLPISMQAATLNNNVIHMSLGIRGGP
ncbi:MAG: hypothetical protein KDB80_15790, partial [Planctomycetes bacterium]|nr:hypothetical protein [Planctomycetota bacterium]